MLHLFIYLFITASHSTVRTPANTKRLRPKRLVSLSLRSAFASLFHVDDTQWYVVQTDLSEHKD